MSRELIDLLAKTFIQRTDVKAIQHKDGSYQPHWTDFDSKTRIPWRREDLEAHVAGKTTFGHYLLDRQDQCKLFCLDIDLIDSGFLPTIASPALDTLTDDAQVDAWFDTFVPCDPRAAWRDRSHPGREWIKFQMRMLGGKLARKVHEELGIRTAVAYSGSKGIHVYGFTGTVSAADARDAAEIVLDSTGEFELKKGRHFFKHRDQSIKSGFPNFSIEVYPKQESLSEKDLGNLLRLPLGVNHKSSSASPDPTFFVDLTAPLSVLRPVDPIWALTTENAWSVPGA